MWTRLYSRLRGEMPAGVLDAYRRASDPVLVLMDRVESRRLQGRIEGRTPWTVPPAIRAEFLCAWNAFVLQTLGTSLLDADYLHHPGTAGHLPRATAAQARAWFEQVEAWVSRAEQAQANPSYRLDTFVPAVLPSWHAEPGGAPAHLAGLLRALESLSGHATAALSFLPDAVTAPHRQAQAQHIRQLHAAAEASARYAEELARGRAAPDAHYRAEVYARWAVEDLYQLGQWIAEPGLAREVRRRAEPAPWRRRRWYRPTLLEIALEPGKEAEARRTALFTAAMAPRASADELIALYDQVSEWEIKDMVIFCLQARREPRAMDKVAQIAQVERDPELRRVATFWLQHSPNERAAELRRQLFR